MCIVYKAFKTIMGMKGITRQAGGNNFSCALLQLKLAADALMRRRNIMPHCAMNAG